MTTKSMQVLLNITNLTAKEVGKERFTIQIITAPQTMLNVFIDETLYEIPISQIDARQFAIELLEDLIGKDKGIRAIVDGEISTSGSKAQCYATRIIITEGLTVTSHVSRN